MVENAISHIKKWRVCSSPLRYKVDDLEAAKTMHNKLYVVCAGLVNDFVMPIKQ